MSGCTCVIQGCEDARRSFFFNQVADNLVVEELDGRPLDLFSNVFFLLSLESQLNKDLLQLFVDIIDA